MIKLNTELIKTMRTDKKGYKSHIVQFFGFDFPPPKGWLRAVAGKGVKISVEDFQYLVDNRNLDVDTEKRRFLDTVEFKKVNSKKSKKTLPVGSVWKEQLGIDIISESTHNCTWENRNRRLRDLGLTYQEYLASKEWRQIKYRASKNEFYSKCYVCGSTNNLHLHHKSYKWIGTKHAMSAILRVCSDCHQGIHELAKEMDIPVQLATKKFWKNYKKSKQWED